MKKLYLAYLKYNRDWYFMHSFSGKKADIYFRKYIKFSNKTFEFANKHNLEF